MKDLFSAQAEQYAIFRPQYPAMMYQQLYQHLKNFDRAWDCATGNGQVAAVLAQKFKEVQATDISDKQLTQAMQKENIVYQKAAAEDHLFPDNFFDLVTVAQGIHWFRFNDFYNEAKRVLKPDGIIAVIGYGLIRVNEAVNAMIDDFYKNKVGPYWDKERKYVDEEYKTIPFPFTQLPCPKLSIQYNWNLEHLLGYINTWSSVQHYSKANNQSPLDKDFMIAIHRAWPHNAVLPVEFPLFLRIGKLS
ncbi:class I SAM-dependent methyltransferase [Foetidibacter luteolus]|uniref:class I SAM-dependent methyltransferase n=1 Tax=Foetidibacter luteolus TaxID=2608880 RepID=UPI00129A8119|nr:class I SAM-dependent methyltransferase [Foetidibacter luteolus]